MFQPLVGSEIYKKIKEEGKLKKIKFSECDYSKASFLPKKIKSLKELKRLQKKAILEFYLRPRVLFRFIMDNLSISQITEIILMFKKYILNKN